VSTAAALRAAADDVWEAQHAHPFVRGIADGSLDEERFRFYVRQDYVFLIDYGRLLALGAARAPRLADMRRLAALAQAVLETEMTLHTGFAQRWGIAVAELEAEAPAPATRGYCDFLLRTAATGDFADLCAALLPCMWGYAEIGARLAASGPPEHAGYATWIATYADPEFQALAAWCRELVDTAAADAGPAALDRMHAAFRTSSQLELGFWESAWRHGAGAG
jgi:thiaminase/transcriptional activator TenA